MTRPTRHAVIDAAFILAVSVIVIIWGQPRPFAIIAAGAGALTGAFILIRAVNGDYDDGDDTW